MLLYLKAQLSAGQQIPTSGCVFLSVKNRDKAKLELIAKPLIDMGFELIATAGTAKYLDSIGVKASTVYKVYEGRPNMSS